MKQLTITLTLSALVGSVSFAQRSDERHPNQRQEQPSDEAGIRAERSMKAALKEMRDADKLTDKQVDELFNIVFPKDIDWDARYEAYLKENPAVAKAVDRGKISKEKVIAGLKSRDSEKPLSEKEQLEALYQKLLKDDPTLGRTPKAALMPRLKAMLERGEGKNLRPKKSIRQRMRTFGLYFNGLIESGQVERFDEDMQKAYDVGAAEIARQGRQGKALVSKSQAAWRYLDTRDAPPRAWIEPGFDDSKWKKGRAPLGYGEDDIATSLDFGEAESKLPVAFFRLKFQVKEASEAYAATIRADDGAVIYLNGKEIHRLRVPEGEIDYSEYQGQLATNERDFFLFSIDPASIVKGDNVLAVSVHQSSARSSDLALDFEILGVTKEVLAGLEERELDLRAHQRARARRERE